MRPSDRAKEPVDAAHSSRPRVGAGRTSEVLGQRERRFSPHGGARSATQRNGYLGVDADTDFIERSIF